MKREECSLKTCKRNKKIMFGTAIILLLTVLILTSARPETPPFTDEDGKVLEGSIALMEQIDLNGTRQWVYFRGRDTTKPLLLFLHGGPGTAATGLIRKFIPELENRFIVVHWDQRGAGKSFSEGGKRADFTVEQMIADVGTLTEIVLDRFGQDKLYLMGVSWGSYLGIEAVCRWPEYYTAYIGSGQVVFQDLGEKLSYRYALKQSMAHHDSAAIKSLEKIGPPPYQAKKHVRSIMKQRHVLARYGGSFHNRTVQREFSRLATLWQVEEYNLLDKFNWIRGQLRSERILGPVFRQIDFRVTAPRIDLPVYFAQGKYDMQTPTSLVQEYFDLLQAPLKSLRIFRGSAHLPLAEEKEEFLAFLDEVIGVRNQRL
ncbi:MAG: alpha/beta hydrolase [Saprospiraceae bacterium]|nr:alpha/beta hydrolase [Saprospiraceae bacterium]